VCNPEGVAIERLALRCLFVDDSAAFLVAARSLLEREGITVVGVASTGAEALQRAEELEPDVILLDVGLGEESGFDVARRLAEETSSGTPSVILISTRSRDELAELIDASPAVGFLSKPDLSAKAIHDLLGIRLDGGRCAHEALVYSTMEEFLAGTVPFVREGLDAGHPVLVATKRANLRMLREALDADAGRVDFVDSAEWYRDPTSTFEAYDRYTRVRLERGAARVRIIGEPVWPRTSARAVAEWKRYESVLNVAFRSYPAWVVCPYDAGELPGGILADAERTHPALRSGQVTRPSPRYTDPEIFVRELGLELSEIQADQR
jgi:CheY-like chemotaxis protein